MSSRLLRHGPVRADGDVPSPTAKDGSLNWAYFRERIQREADNRGHVVGLYVTLAGTIVAGALPFTLDSFFCVHAKKKARGREHGGRAVW
jgi:hypothetical protein